MDQLWETRALRAVAGEGRVRVPTCNPVGGNSRINNNRHTNRNPTNSKRISRKLISSHRTRLTQLHRLHNNITTTAATMPLMPRAICQGQCHRKLLQNPEGCLHSPRFLENH